MDDKLIELLKDAEAIIKAIDSEYITQQELEDVVALIIASIEDSAASIQEKLDKIPEDELAYYAKCSKAIEDCKEVLEARLKEQADYWAKVHTKEVKEAVDLALSRVAAIKGEKGDSIKGDPGEPGAPGKDGSPDTPDEVTEKVNLGKPLIKKERVEGLADIERMAKANSFNPTMGPSFSDLSDIRKTVTTLTGVAKAVTINYIVDGGGADITTGVKGYVEIPYDMTITGWQIFGDQVGSVVVDVWKSTYGNFPPVVGGSIAGSELPTLASAQSNRDMSLSTWTTSLSSGDILAYNINSASSVTRITVSIIGVKN